MSKADELISEIRKAQRLIEEIPKPVQKIKMKEEFYNNLAREIHQQYKLIEVLDVDKQPLNKIMDIRIEIDNEIEKDYEVVV